MGLRDANRMPLRTGRLRTWGIRRWFLYLTDWKLPKGHQTSHTYWLSLLPGLTVISPEVQSRETFSAHLSWDIAAPVHLSWHGTIQWLKPGIYLGRWPNVSKTFTAVESPDIGVAMTLDRNFRSLNSQSWKTTWYSGSKRRDTRPSFSGFESWL